jgi:putative endonuclease
MLKNGMTKVQNSKQPCVYIMASARRGTLYNGVTSDLIKRIYEHKNKITDGFTAKYNINNLVYFEQHENMEAAILREKKIKKWSRQFKYNLIEEKNPDWEDLYNKITASAY